MTAFGRVRVPFPGDPACCGQSPPTFQFRAMTQASAKPQDTQALDALTGGAFSAPTSGERAARVRDWLASQPPVEQLQDVFRELSARDKGAARPLREKLDEIKRAKGQEVIAAEWADKAQALLGQPKLNIADALAWQRDAAKAGAPLSREPLASVKQQLAERVRIIEDLQHRVQVQREAAVLLAQRIEVLSTKSWKDAQAALAALDSDVAGWQTQATDLLNDTNWASVDAKFPPQLDASRAQLLVVWDAFQGAVAQTVAAASDAAAPLPSVPMWASELRALRGVSDPAPEVAGKAGKPRLDPEQLKALRDKAHAVVGEVLGKLEQETAEGHGKASAGAASALRNALKEHGKFIGPELDARAQAALGTAGELEGWQRWRADQLREELVGKAEGLLKRHEGQALGGRKMQDTLRGLREQWKQTDQGGVPNHGLWKRFDEACNEAYKVVEAWLEKVKADAAEHRQQRLALIEEVKAWASDNRVAKDNDWKGFNRVLHQFADRWRDSGHVGEKVFAELQPLWKAALQTAAEPLEAVQKDSLARRQAMIDEAAALGAAPTLRIDAVKALQQRWQAEAQTVPLDRKHEQKLWDAFRKPIDDAFQRKTTEREQASAALTGRDRAVLEAAKALDAANASGDAPTIRAAVAVLEAALRGQAQAVADVAATQFTDPRQSGPVSDEKPAIAHVESGSAAINIEADTSSDADGQPGADTSGAATAEAPAAPTPPPKPVRPVVAMRGDDRPGMKKAETAPAGRGGKFGDRPGSRGPGRDGRPGDRTSDRGPRPDRYGDRSATEDRGPRLGDAAFRAQREALEKAEFALRKLAAQAHGEALTQLLTAWEKRDASQLPGTQELGGRVSAAVRGLWSQALSSPPVGDAQEALLRLEMAAEVPTPADQLPARRALQLQLLTRRNDPAPAQTWGQDTARVLAAGFDAAQARRVQNVLKVLLKR